MGEKAGHKVNTIGGFTFSDGADLHRITRRKAQALLTYLWLQPNHTESRSRLANLLWSRSGETDARVSLRQELSRLNKELASCSGSQVLAGDKFSIWLARKPEPSDADAIVAALEAGSVPAVLTEKPLLQEEFLSHLEGVDPELDLWIAVQRASFARRCTRLLKEMLKGPGGSNAPPEDAALALLNLDPTDEGACRGLMEIALARDDRAGALALFEELTGLLRSKYAVEPGQDLRDYARSLQEGGDTASPAVVPPQPRPKPSAAAAEGSLPQLLLLVHPAQTMNADAKAQQRFSILRSELIGALSRFRDWSVREYSGADAYPGTEQLPGKVYELTISGEAGDGGDYLTINLIAADTRACLWSESLEVDYARIAGQKRDAIRKLATALNVEISAHRLSQILSVTDTELDIYDKWLLGESLLLNWRPEDEARAESIFRSILVQSGTFAPAIAGLVQILNTRHHIFPGVMRDHGREAEALMLARRASRMAPHDCRTQLTLAWCYLMNGEFDQAIYYYRLALDINDNDPWTLISAAQGLCYAGEKAQAIDLADRAMTSGRGGEPMHWAYTACIRYHVGNFPGALDAVSRAGGAAYFVGGMKIAILGQIGDEAAAAQAIRDFMLQVGKAWAARQDPTPENIRAWFLQLFPIRMQADLEKLEAGLDKAGFGVR
jgi:DNA-binding SARP family transcriptional activator